MKQVELMTSKGINLLTTSSIFFLRMFLVFLVFDSFGQGPDNLNEVESQVQGAWDNLKSIIKIFYIASLVIGGSYVIWAFSSKKQDATNYLIFWIIGLVVYFILKALFF